MGYCSVLKRRRMQSCSTIACAVERPVLPRRHPQSPVYRIFRTHGVQGGDDASARAASFQQEDDTYTVSTVGPPAACASEADSQAGMQPPVPERVYVALWAGTAMHEPMVHPPFNLLLRLLIALCPDVIIPVSSAAASLFDVAVKPYGTGAGMSEDYCVQHRASATAAVKVRQY